MYERAYGEKNNGTWRDAADIAKDIRADIKAARQAGEINLPEGAKISVRCSKYSGGQSIDVNVTGWVGHRIEVEDAENFWPGFTRRELTPEADEVQGRLERIVRAYNWDGSDSQSDYFDVCFYGHVSFDGASWLTRWTPPAEAVEAPATEEAVTGDPLTVYYGYDGREAVVVYEGPVSGSSTPIRGEHGSVRVGYLVDGVEPLNWEFGWEDPRVLRPVRTLPSNPDFLSLDEEEEEAPVEFAVDAVLEHPVQAKDVELLGALIDFIHEEERQDPYKLARALLRHGVRFE